MDATVVNTRSRIAQLYGDLQSITTAYDYIPRQIAHSELPAALVWPSQAEILWPRGGANELIINRTYTALVLLTSATSGQEGESEKRALDINIFDDVLRTFGKSIVRAHLMRDNQPLNGVQEAYITNDTGLVVRSYPFNTDMQYLAVEFTHIVSTLFRS